MKKLLFLMCIGFKLSFCSEESKITIKDDWGEAIRSSIVDSYDIYNFSTITASAAASYYCCNEII